MFDIARVLTPATLEEALSLLAAEEHAKIIAGGTDVLVKLREGKFSGATLISIHDLASLKTVRMDDAGAIHIGPGVSFRDLTEDPIIRQHLPLLAEAAATVGGPQIRVMGTVGGNLANGAPSADTAGPILALGARLMLESTSGSRMLPIEEFWLGPGKTAIRPDEILTDIIIEQDHYAETGGCYLKYAMREAMDIATLGTTVLVRPKDGVIRDIRLAFTVAAPTPIRARNTEAALIGKPAEEAIAAIAELVRAELSPRDSWRASRSFRLQVAGENAVRALQKALENAGREPA